MAQLTTPPRLHDAYAEALPGSHGLFERAGRLFPDAVTHDNRRIQPFPLYVDRADGAYKWDVDGHRYVDYWMVHGALLLGRNPPVVRDAVREQTLRSTHYGACHPMEVEWGEWVCRPVHGIVERATVAPLSAEVSVFKLLSQELGEDRGRVADQFVVRQRVGGLPGVRCGAKFIR